MKALIIAATGIQDQEFVVPYYRLQEAGYTVFVAAPVEPGEKAFQGIGGLWLPAHRRLPFPGVPHPDLLVLPGGVKAMEKLRLEPKTLDFIREYHAAGNVIGSMCSGAQLLISARLVKGRTISAYPAMQIDVENAGGTFHPGPVVTDDRIVSSPHYKHLGEWMKALLEEADRVRWIPRHFESATCAAAL